MAYKLDQNRPLPKPPSDRQICAWGHGNARADHRTNHSQVNNSEIALFVTLTDGRIQIKKSLHKAAALPILNFVRSGPSFPPKKRSTNFPAFFCIHNVPIESLVRFRHAQ